MRTPCLKDLGDVRGSSRSSEGCGLSGSPLLSSFAAGDCTSKTSEIAMSPSAAWKDVEPPSRTNLLQEQRGPFFHSTLDILKQGAVQMREEVPQWVYGTLYILSWLRNREKRTPTQRVGDVIAREGKRERQPLKRLHYVTLKLTHLKNAIAQ